MLHKLLQPNQLDSSFRQYILNRRVSLGVFNLNQLGVDEMLQHDQNVSPMSIEDIEHEISLDVDLDNIKDIQEIEAAYKLPVCP